MSRIVPAMEVRSEILILNSRFIATLGPTSTVEDAKSFISRIKDEFPGATHNVPAYIIGHGNSIISHCSDDGEPSGTAGKPVLAVLRGSGFGDVAVVVTRYFGGKKLGTGGLVRAYSEVTKAVIDITPRAKKIKTYSISIRTSYSFYDRIHATIKEFNGEIIEEKYSNDVTISAILPMEYLHDFTNYAQDLTSGELTLEIIDETEAIKSITNTEE